MSESSFILDFEKSLHQSKNDMQERNSPQIKQMNDAKSYSPPKEIPQKGEEPENQIVVIEKEINLIKNQLDSANKQISILKQNISSIPASYNQNIYEIEKLNKENHLKIELQNKENLEKLMEIKTHELKLKNEEMNRKNLEKDKFLYDKLVIENTIDIEKTKRDLEIACKSLISRQLFYEKEVEDLTKAENSIRESLINLGKSTEIIQTSYEIQIDNLRKNIQIQRFLYENKLKDSYSKLLSKEDLYEIEILAEKINRNEEEMQILERRKIEENIMMSPSKKLALHKLEAQLVL